VDVDVNRESMDNNDTSHRDIVALELLEKKNLMVPVIVLMFDV
jgi:hypothetical protein